MWNKKLVNSIMRIARLSNRQRELHSQSYHYYRKMYKIFMYGSLFLAPLSTGSSSFGLVDSKNNSIFAIVSTISSALSFLSLSILKNGNYEQIAQAHQMAIAKYSVLINNIIKHISLPIEDRPESKKYIKWLTDTYDITFDASPYVHSGLEGEFDAAFFIDIEDPSEPARSIHDEIKEDSGDIELIIEDTNTASSNNSDKSTLSSIELQLRNTALSKSRGFKMEKFFSTTQSKIGRAHV